MARNFRSGSVALLIALGLASAVELAAAEWQWQARPQPPAQTENKDKDQKASGHQGTPWWKDDKARVEIGFTAEQAAEIDRIFKANIDKAKALREEVNALEDALSATMKANTADISVVEKQVEKVENKRAELNKLRVVMLYRMHRVLTPEQNARLQAFRDRREAERRKQDGDRRR